MTLTTHKIAIDMPHLHTRESVKLVKNSSAKARLEEFVPAGVKGIARLPLKIIADHRREIFIRKLYERLACKRNGTRIYNALISKLENELGNDNSEYQMNITLLEEFRSQEAEHFSILSDCIKKLGADPARIPDAVEISVAARTYMNIITHPQASISQCIGTMLHLEFVDNAAWESLIQMADAMSLSNMADEFRFMLRQEEIHLVTFREWYEEVVASF